MEKCKDNDLGNPPEEAPSPGEARTPRLELTADQRRVLGVLIEKSLTTPQYYPLTLNALVAGCNQKSNRDPIVSYMEGEAEELLQQLRKAGLATLVYPAGGRTEKWRQEYTGQIGLSGQQMAVLAELLLRGTQTLGELRARAGRMKPIPDQESLDGVLLELMNHEPPLVVRLTALGVKRGVRVTHNLYQEAEWVKVLEAEQGPPAFGSPAFGSPAFGSPAFGSPAFTQPSAGSSPFSSLSCQVEALNQRMGVLEERLHSLEERLRQDSL